MQNRLAFAFVGLVVMSAAGSPEPASAQAARGVLDSERVAKLQKLAGEALVPERAHPPRNRDVRAVLDALDALDRELAALEERPAEARSRSAGDRRRGAEAALTRLRARMHPERAEQLGAAFAPLWADVDAALASPSSRRGGNLADARRRIRDAKRGGTEVHDLSLGAFSAGEPN